MDSRWIVTFVFAGLVALCEGCGESPEASRIVDGEEAEPHSIPWQVRLEIGKYANFKGARCGGTIICEKFVMTAGHCMENPLTGFALTGSTDPMLVNVLVGDHSVNDKYDRQTKYTVKKIHIHPNYTKKAAHRLGGMIYDFTLLELNEPIDFSSKVTVARPACLPEASDSRIYKNGTNFVASGWGSLSESDGDYSHLPDKLRRVTIPYQHNKYCQVDFPCGLHPWSEKCGPGVPTKEAPIICAGTHNGKGVGKGDSGGPLTWMDDKTLKVKLMGVTSYGHWDSAFADVTKVLDWIQDVTGGCNNST